MKYLLLCSAAVLSAGLENPEQSNALLSGQERRSEPLLGARTREEAIFIGGFVFFEDRGPEAQVAARQLLEELLHKSCMQSPIDADTCFQIAKKGAESAKAIETTATVNGCPIGALFAVATAAQEQQQVFSGESVTIPGEANISAEEPNNPDNGQQ